MEATSRKTKPALGFLTVTDHPQDGLFGGYLVLNMAGRPLEFHCTAPIKPNRAQEILYGHTLEAFIYGEQIGQTLINQSSTSTQLVFTDREPALAARQHVSAPLVMVLPSDPRIMPPVEGDSATAAESAKTFRLDTAHDDGPRLALFQHGGNRLALPERDGKDRRLIVERLAELEESFDLSEPFERIREAIEEARQAAR